MPSKRRGSALRWVLVAGVAAVVVGGGVAVLNGPSGGGNSASMPRTADRTAAKRQSFDITITASGELDARRRVEIRSPLEQEAAIVEIAAEGTFVRRGDVLVKLNTDAIQQKIDDEKLRLQTAEGDLKSAENAFRIQENENASKLAQAQLKVDLAELAYSQWREGDVRKKRQQLDLAINRATLELERLAEKLRRSEELLEEGFLSKNERDLDEVAYIEAIAKYEEAFLSADVYESYEYRQEEKSKLSDHEQALAELDRTRLDNEIQLQDKRTKLDTQRSQVELLRARLDKLIAQQGAAIITAPTDGLVVWATSLDRGGWGGREGPFQIGQKVAANQLLIILPDTTEMIAAIRVQESLAGRVREGMNAMVTVDAAGGKTFTGRVDSIGVMAETGGWRDPNLREYTVRVALDEPGTNLKPAMRCDAVVLVGSVPDALTIPVQAVFNDGAVRYVYVEKGGKFSRQPIRTGRRSESVVEINSGIEEGRVVLLRQPQPGEVLNEPWDSGALIAAGYQIGENGQVTEQAGMRQPGGDGSSAPVRRNGPGGGRPRPEGSGGSQQPATTEGAGSANSGPAAVPPAQAAAASIDGKQAR